MSKEEFIALALEAGYTESEVKGFLSFHEETGMPFCDMALMERCVN